MRTLVQWMFSPLFFLSFIFAASSISQNTGSATN